VLFVYYPGDVKRRGEHVTHGHLSRVLAGGWRWSLVHWRPGHFTQGYWKRGLPEV